MFGYALVGMTILLGTIPHLSNELSSRPERSGVEGSAVSLRVNEAA